MNTSSKFVPPPTLLLQYYLTSHLDSHTTNDVKPEMLSSVQTGNRIPHDEINVRGIAHACAYIKDDIFMQRLFVQSLKYIKRGSKGLKDQSFCKRCNRSTTRTLTKLSWPKHIPACRSELSFIIE